MLQRRKGCGQGLALVVSEFVDQPHKRMDARPAPRPDVRRAGLGQRHQRDPLIGRVASPLDQPGFFHHPNQDGHRGLGDTLNRGQIGDSSRAGPIQGGQGGSGRDGQVTWSTPYGPGSQSEESGPDCTGSATSILTTHAYSIQDLYEVSMDLPAVALFPEEIVGRAVTPRAVIVAVVKALLRRDHRSGRTVNSCSLPPDPFAWRSRGFSRR